LGVRRSERARVRDRSLANRPPSIADGEPSTEPAPPLIDLPGEVSPETREKVTQVLVRIIVRQVRAELKRSDGRR